MSEERFGHNKSLQVRDSETDSVLIIGRKKTFPFYLLTDSATLKDYPCAPGHWCPGRRDAFLCPPGSFRTQPGATSLEECDLCPSGFYCPDPIKTGVPNSHAIPCAAGYECPPGERSPLVAFAHITMPAQKSQ